MKKLTSAVLFLSIFVLSSLEVVPKFYQVAIPKVEKPLFVSVSKRHVSEEEKGMVSKKTEEIDYKKLVEGINAKGA